MKKELQLLLTRIKYDFILNYSDDMILKTAASWEKSITQLKLDIKPEDLQRAYEAGLENNIFEFGINIQKFITAIKQYIMMKKTKADRKIFRG